MRNISPIQEYEPTAPDVLLRGAHAVMPASVLGISYVARDSFLHIKQNEQAEARFHDFINQHYSLAKDRSETYDRFVSSGPANQINRSMLTIAKAAICKFGYESVALVHPVKVEQSKANDAKILNSLSRGLRGATVGAILVRNFMSPISLREISVQRIYGLLNSLDTPVGYVVPPNPSNLENGQPLDIDQAASLGQASPALV
jgi:hypothetical protein